jgi:hypothetical protein
MKIARSVTVIGVLLAGTLAYSDEHASTDCQTVLDRLRWLEDSTRQSIANVEDYRQRAQRLSEWFGAERFDGYLAAMRHQQATLRAQLDELRRAKCPQQPR